MARTNEKSDVTPEVLRYLCERISTVASKFSDTAEKMESHKIKSISLPLDSFKSVTLERLEAFSRTVGREYIRSVDSTIDELVDPKPTKKKGT